VYRLSVVIPSLNRADILARTIDRIEHQTVSRETYEVLVINNNSSDHTESVLSQKGAVYPNLRSFTQLKPGAAATRNVGIRESAGDIILFIDDDILADPQLVANHLKYHKEYPGNSVIGTVVSQWEKATDPFLRYLRDRGIFNPYSIACNRPMDFSYYHTGNASTSRKLLQGVGGFNEDFRVYGMEDIELGYRLEKQGCRMTPGPLAAAHHEYYPTYQQFIERCLQAGFSLGKLIELHPELRTRFTEKGKNTRLLKRLHPGYRVLRSALNPFCKSLIGWESRRGTGKVNAVLDQHYYWAIRYHFFLGYREYVQTAESGRTTQEFPEEKGQRVPKLAIERHD
jgi:glycosyltransferase involved in cell wall biosynthesis